MTREEYEQLLKSDYWKGYSYSLIKERNFTCEDCGRSFPNERNKLQVHHLVYRDVYPWSYKPEEVVVLCEECHMKRHGLYVEKPNTEPVIAEVLPTAEELPNQPKEEQKHTNEYRPKTTDNYSKGHYDKGDDVHRKRMKPIYKVCGAIILIAVFVNVFQKHENYVTEEDIPVNEVISDSALDNNPEQVITEEKKEEPRPASKTSNKNNSQKNQDSRNTVDVNPQETTVESTPTRQKTTSELLAERNHANAVKRAEEVGVSTEGSTSDILGRINHANAVKHAKEVGVSTEGSTSDILGRINHANAVKRAKEVGVSTEGSTSDILGRINHANAVKRAEEVGVSTEGSTSDILGRIARKSLEDLQ